MILPAGGKNYSTKIVILPAWGTNYSTKIVILPGGGADYSRKIVVPNAGGALIDNFAPFEKTLLARTRMQTTAFLGPFFDFESGFIVKFESTAKPERKTQIDHLERAI